MSKILNFLLFSLPVAALAQSSPSMSAASSSSLASVTSLERPLELGTPGSVPAVDPLPMQDVVSAGVDQVWNALQTRNYLMLLGLLLLGAVWIARRKMTSVAKLDPEMLPLVGLILASFPAIAMTLMRPGVDGKEIVSVLVATWLLSAGSWENIVKPLVALYRRVATKVRGWLDSAPSSSKSVQNIVGGLESPAPVKMDDPTKPKE